MPYTNDSSSFQAVLITLFRNSAEVVVDEVGSGHEIVLHFHHRRRLELLLQLNSETEELILMNWNHCHLACAISLFQSRLFIPVQNSYLLVCCPFSKKKTTPRPGWS